MPSPFRSALFLIVLALGGCATTKQSSLMISPGDSKEKVASVMGSPDDRQFKNTQEAWQYGMVVTIGVCDYTVIWFESGKVTGLNSYRNTSTLGCRAGLHSINWEQAPNTVIELRNR
jgi:hypothetical protein